MSHHASFLLGQALESLASVVDATDLDTAITIASATLAGIVPSAADWAGVERGTRSPLIGDGAATPHVSATGNPPPEAVPSPVLRALSDSPACGNPSGSYVCIRDAHPRQPQEHVYIRPQQMKGGESDGDQPYVGLVGPGVLAGGKDLASGSPRYATKVGGSS